MKFSAKRCLDNFEQKQREKERRRGPKGPGAKRYFDDFEVRTVLGKNGKPKRELIYIGDTFTALVPEPVYQRRKKLFFALAILCAVIFVAANGVNVSSNRQGLLAGLGILMVIPLFLVCYSCACRLRKGLTLQRAEYVETSMFLKFGAFFAAVLGIVLFVWHGIWALGSALPGERGGEVFVTLAWGILAACSVYLWIREVTTEYRQRNREGNVIQKQHFKRNG